MEMRPRATANNQLWKARQRRPPLRIPTTTRRTTVGKRRRQHRRWTRRRGTTTRSSSRRRRQKPRRWKQQQQRRRRQNQRRNRTFWRRWWQLPPQLPADTRLAEGTQVVVTYSPIPHTQLRPPYRRSREWCGRTESEGDLLPGAGDDPGKRVREKK